MHAVAQDCSKRIFRTTKKEHFENFNGKITIVNKNTIKYDDRVIEIWNADSLIMLIFEKGILHPEIVVGDFPIKTKSQLDSLTEDQKILYNLTRSDSSIVSNIESVTLGDESSKIKRFKILAWKKSLLNPSLYYFELTNENANDKTDFKTFILGAKLTIFKFCSILI